MRRAIAYIDGFNLYNGIKEEGWQHLYWLNVWDFAESFVRNDAKLVRLKYFTAMVIPPRYDPQKRERQRAYLDALGTVPTLEIRLGHYLRVNKKCPKCRNIYKVWQEKSTDVSIALHMLADGYHDRYDDLLLMTGDGDLRDAVCLAHEEWPDKRITIVFPPKRVGRIYQQLAREGKCACLHTDHRRLLQSQFPDPVIGENGRPIRRPGRWQ